MEGKLIIGSILVLCLAWQVQAQSSVNCAATGAGRYPDTNDPTCRNYTLCIYSANTATFLAYNYICPSTSVFNPNSQQCTTNFTCNQQNTAVAANPCTQDGFVANPASTDCTTYIQCVQINGVFTQTTLTCPAGTLYNPTSTLCDPNYTCPTAVTFTCPSAGRFANIADTTCQTYYLCVFVPTNNTFIPYQYTCPTTSMFSPASRLCTTNYICPILVG